MPPCGWVTCIRAELSLAPSLCEAKNSDMRLRHEFTLIRADMRCGEAVESIVRAGPQQMQVFLVAVMYPWFALALPNLMLLAHGAIARRGACHGGKM